MNNLLHTTAWQAYYQCIVTPSDVEVKVNCAINHKERQQGAHLSYFSR